LIGAARAARGRQRERTTAYVRDGELVVAAAVGDEGAWGVLVERHAQLVWDTVRSCGLDERSSARASESTWLRLVDQLHDFGGGADIRGWLVSVAREEAQRPAR
jgi:DNA-directed RNA polymerase specialized sigma24 family protein